MGMWETDHDEYCEVCEKVTVHHSWNDGDESGDDCTEHEEYEQDMFDARKKILELLDAKDTIQELLQDNHTENNCDCDQDYGTVTMKSEGASDIDVCLKCFGADGCVY